jgi:tetratricopeptide (TPR) repeat protein
MELKTSASAVVENYDELLNQYQHRKANSVNLDKVAQLIRTTEEVMQNDGKLEVAVILIKQALQMQDKLLPGDYSQLEKCIKMLNNKAMVYLDKGQDDRALYLLQNAEKFVRKYKDYRGQSEIANLYNNMALGLQRHNFLGFAKDYLERAQSLNFRYRLPTGKTDLNYGCLLSAMNK